MGIGRGKKRFSVTLTVEQFLDLQRRVALKGLSIDQAASLIIADYLDRTRQNLGKDEHNGNSN